MKISESGQIFILGAIISGLVLVNVLILLSNSSIFNQKSNYSSNVEEVLSLTEAGIDKAVASLNKTAGTYSGEEETFLGKGSFSTTVTNLSSTLKQVESTGYIPNKTNPKVKRTVKIQLSRGIGAAFPYGLQVGDGGLSLGNGDILNGSVYSNGNVTSGNNTQFSGDVYVAGGVQPIADQSSTCVSPNCSDFFFGKSISGNSILDIAQSFKPSVNAAINKISVNLKKVGSPPDITVRILKDSNGKPDKNNVLASGTLNSSLVGSAYGFVDVSLSTSPQLDADTTYWIVLDTSSNSSNYWSWSQDLLKGYSRGEAFWSPNWSASNPLWNNINADLDFKTYMGGVATSVTGSNGVIVTGSVHANTINQLTINQDAYSQILNNSTVKGTIHPNSQDPPPKPMPVSDSNINEWKTTATDQGSFNGDISLGSNCSYSLVAGKYIGNLTSGSGCTIKVSSPVWVTGNISLGNSSKFVLDSSFGIISGTILVDGTTTLGNGADLLGSGSSGSSMMLVSTFDSRSNGNTAVTTGNTPITGIIYAPYGEVSLPNGASFKEISAWKIILGNTATLNYDTGLASMVFSTGPGGAFSVVKGTYQVK